MTHLSPAAVCNRDCRCQTTDRAALHGALAAGLSPQAADLVAARPLLFADSAVFVSPEEVERMAGLIAAVERVVALPAYRDAMLSLAPHSALRDPGAHGAFVSYDFHLTGAGPRLIEINTNAGGALLGAAVARAQEMCCQGLAPSPGLAELEHTLFAMFSSEWRLQRGSAPLWRVAIVDDGPESQFLFPEFLLFRDLFTRHGVEAVVVDAAALDYRDGVLLAEGRPVDLVYNRLCDFPLVEPRHAALAAAYDDGAAVVTPHPHAHALRADKRALIVLTDDALLAEWGVGAVDRAVLAAGIPRTEAVTADRADQLWAARNRLFFKPTSGYGSKAAYRGDKLTRRVWGEIQAGSYVAQELAPPSERSQASGRPMKVDLRAFVYQGVVQFLSARLYQGQTTNFQTPGGGLAAVFVMEGHAIPRKDAVL
jgi:hypothetical protein